MDAKQELEELAAQNNLCYEYQQFENCYGGNWRVYTHSLYNETGCFTIYNLPHRAEVSFYFAKSFSRDLSALCAHSINVYEYEKDIWKKDERIGPFKNPFYFWKPDHIVKTLIRVITELIKKNREFFGVKVSPL